MRYLAIIPARGGSKGIKEKNIIGINGKPLIWYSIDPALRLTEEGEISDLIVTTDSEKIASMAKAYGATVPFLRPDEISGDQAKSVDFVLHALDYFEQQGVKYDAVIILQPTSPLRTYEDIKEAISLYDSGKSDSLISAYKDEALDALIMYKKEDDLADPLDPNHNTGIRRQDKPDIYIRNGAIYIVSAEYVRKHNKLIADKPLMQIMPQERSVNLDEQKDLITIERIICE